MGGVAYSNLIEKERQLIREGGELITGDAEWDALWRAQVLMYPQAPPANLWPKLPQPNVQRGRKARRLTLVPIPADWYDAASSEPDLHGVASPEANSERVRAQQRSLIEGIRDGTINWMNCAIHSRRKEEESAMASELALDVLMNYLSVEGREEEEGQVLFQNGSDFAAQKEITVLAQLRGDKPTRWLWVCKGHALRPELGFPARTDEVRRFGGSARRLEKREPKLTDSRSFASVVKGETMNRAQGKAPQESGRDRTGGAPNQQRPPGDIQGNFRGGANARNAGGEWREGPGGNRFGGGGRGGPNFRPDASGGGFKRGNDERDLHGEQLEFDLRSKLSRDRDFGSSNRESHCFNCNRDGHYQASCPNPPFCYSCKKDGHKAMACPTKQGLNLRVCGHGLPGQAFYSIHIPEEGTAVKPSTFPGLLTVSEGTATEKIIDIELKYLFKGRSGWTIKKLSDMEFMLYFPSEELRFELTKFRGFEFATAAVKAKVVPTDVEKLPISNLDETWVIATGFPTLAKKVDAIKAISYLVGDPIEVDENLLKSEGTVRVKVYCKDASKLVGTTLLHINGHGHLINWKSEKAVTKTPQINPPPKGSKFHRLREDSEEDADKEDSDGTLKKQSQDHKEGEGSRKSQDRSAGGGQKDSEGIADDGDFLLSQTNQEMNRNFQVAVVDDMELDEDELVDYEDSLEKEKLEMERIDFEFEERTEKLAKELNIGPQKAEKETNEKLPEKTGGQGAVLCQAGRSSNRVMDKSTKIVDKAKKRKELGFQDPGVWERTVEFVMWRNVAKSALWFGCGSMFFSCSCSRERTFSLISALCHLGVMILGLAFFKDSVPQRLQVEKAMGFQLTVEDVFRASRVVLPVQTP